ncbi:uroporphyrinogen-III C-methyltransferase [Azovibrio restrictus]|uniref:uroporphyrinogen-III C-methyltransferase n=1 Tax=Azovibrio restrictus TaxID=146938 RepID=UPI0026F32141|nr:uroporphyrinogen-III C-methyltransferase [Azovibrio restrictus]
MSDAPQSLVPLAPRSQPAPFWRNPWLWVVLAVLGLVLWQWLETRSRLAQTQQELARRLAESDRVVSESRVLVGKAMEQTAELQRKYGAIEARLAEFQDQADALRALQQEAAVSRDDALLAEVEQALNNALQQLQLSGNVQAAILALEAADARLGRHDRPQFLALRRTLARDLERLRATPFVDVPGMNLRLENVIVGLDNLPLALEIKASARPGADVVPEVAQVPWWRLLIEEGWAELKGLVRIQRFDRQEAVLLSPEQSLILRENIKLRLLNARLALLTRDQWLFRSELKAAHAWLERYFQVEEKSVQASLAALKQLAATEIVVELPSLNDSLAALQNLKASREKR